MTDIWVSIGSLDFLYTFYSCCGWFTLFTNNIQHVFEISWIFHHILNSVLGFMIYCGGNEGDRNYIELFSDVYWSAYWFLSNVTCLIINLTLSSNTFCSDFWLNFLGFSNCWSWRKSQQCYSLLQSALYVTFVCIHKHLCKLVIQYFFWNLTKVWINVKMPISKT